MMWETVIGLETHVELATRSKIFCGCSTAFAGEPNTQCCPVCMGLPGTLPVLNRRVVELALRAGLALNATITPHTRFDRKNYFYPDLPKAYQVSQLYLPIATNGWLELEESGRRIRIHELHMEEDAGKLIHEGDATRIDYNRCGVPLIEIVTEPDFSRADQVVAYLEQLSQTLQYLGISDCKMQEGSLRCDVNLSVRPAGSDTLGVRTEMKNLGSLRAVARAIEYESRRQIRLLEAGGQVEQQTLRWDEDKQVSVPLRTKEAAADYRYFPEPNLPVVHVDEELLSAARSGMGELAWEKRARYREVWGLNGEECRTLTTRRELAEYFEATVAAGAQPKSAAVWVCGQVLRRMGQYGVSVEGLKLTPATLAKIIALVEQGRINRPAGVEVLDGVFMGGDPEEYVTAHGLEQLRDDGAVQRAVEQVLCTHPEQVEQYRQGKEKVMGFLVGQTVRVLGQKADPKLVSQRLRQALLEEKSNS